MNYFDKKTFFSITKHQTEIGQTVDNSCLFQATEESTPASFDAVTAPIDDIPVTTPVTEFPATEDFAATAPVTEFAATAPVTEFAPTAPVTEFAPTAPVTEFAATVPVTEFAPTAPVTEFAPTEPVEDISAKSAPAQPVVGWLVAVEGPSRGKDFRLVAGYNYIGRSNANDISLPGDMQIDSDHHAIVAYTAKDNRFVFAPANGRSIVSVNGTDVLMPVELKERDMIEIGSTKLRFIPLCGSEFHWNLP